MEEGRRGNREERKREDGIEVIFEDIESFRTCERKQAKKYFVLFFPPNIWKRARETHAVNPEQGFFVFFELIGKLLF